MEAEVICITLCQGSKNLLCLLHALFPVCSVLRELMLKMAVSQVRGWIPELLFGGEPPNQAHLPQTLDESSHKFGLFVTGLAFNLL